MRRGIACGALAALVVLLPACTDADPPTPPTTTSSAAPTTPPPTPTPPPRPVDAPTATSAEAFVRYFWQTYNYAYATLEPNQLTALALPRCKFCNSVSDEIKGLKDSRRYATGGEVTPKVVVVPPGDLTRGVIITTVINQVEGHTFNADGTERSRLAPTTNMRSEIALRWQNSAWVVYGVANDEKSGQS